MLCAVFCFTAWALIMGLLFACVQSPCLGFAVPAQPCKPQPPSVRLRLPQRPTSARCPRGGRPPPPRAPFLRPDSARAGPKRRPVGVSRASPAPPAKPSPSSRKNGDRGHPAFLAAFLVVHHWGKPPGVLGAAGSKGGISPSRAQRLLLAPQLQAGRSSPEPRGQVQHTASGPATPNPS